MLTLKIAVITGASSGLGREYAFAAARRYADIDELWLIARREENLRQTAEQISKRVRIIPLDITKEESVKTYISMLEEEKPEIALLINNAGFGKLGDFDKLSYEDNGGMVRLNCEALTGMTSVSLPYMKNGDRQHLLHSRLCAEYPNGGILLYQGVCFKSFKSAALGASPAGD